MGVVTLRNLSPEAIRIIRRRATDRKTSINKVVAGIVEEGLGLAKTGPRRKVYHDLDHLFGVVSKAEGEAFDRALAEQRRIDPELWR